MQRFGIENEMWFELAKSGLERRGFRLRVQQRSIVVEKEQRLPRLMGSAREFLEFAERQGLRVDAGAYAAADRYGDARSDLSGRASESPFETPPSMAPPTEPARFETGSLLRSPPVPGVFGRAVVAEARRAEPLANVRRGEPERNGDRRAPAPPANLIRDLEERCAGLAKRNGDLEAVHAELEGRLAELQAELARAAVAIDEAAKQRDLYQMSVIAAEERIRKLQVELEGPAEERGPDKRFNQLRRYLARELHPDLAGEDAAERAIRETIFKRVWAKIEQLQ
jgi:hypothetical protein